MKNEELNDEWIKNSIGDFIENINEFKKKQIEYMKQKEAEEQNDNSLSQIEK